LYYNHRVLSSGEECARVHVAAVGFGFGLGKFSVFLYKRTDSNQFYQIQHKKRGTHGLESEAFNCAYGATP
jgi:hypothetical protein